MLIPVAQQSRYSADFLGLSASRAGATIRTEEPHDAVARQVFHGEAFWPFYRLAIRIFAQLSGHVARGSAADAAGK